jgi:hypothetical protein
MTSPPRWLYGATSDSAFRAPTVDGVRHEVNPATGSVAGGDHALSSLERDPYTDDGGES